MAVFIRGRIRSEAANPISRFFIGAYRPIIRATLRRPVLVLVFGFSLLGLTLLCMRYDCYSS
jgi:Cu(I)/Ag(I) efflux system membrane protein CusA/SilA